MNRYKGFTILEVCIGLAIVGILATLSINGYEGIREKNNFKAMQELASKLALEQQHYRQKFKRYATQISSSGTSNSSFLVIPNAQQYQIALSSSNSRDFTATIRPTDQALQTPNNCRSLLLFSNRGYLRYETRSASGQNTTSECL
jgi:prepilin-type N-terminal cleavage/methylation domain-containing protein